jgi:tRNA modification GTPase
MLPLVLESIAQMEEWLKTYESGRALKEGLVVVLSGKPNVGKSSLLNCLLREEVAIVHAQAGTTRDPIEKKMSLGGFPVRLIDTAGLRRAEGEVEKMGIERSKQWLEKSDLVIAVFDVSFSLTDEDREVLKALPTTKRHLIVLNKTDLSRAWEIKDLLSEPTKNKEFMLPVSAKTGEGVRELEETIPKLFGIESLQKQTTLMLNSVRHRDAIEKAMADLQLVVEGFQELRSPDLISADVRQATHHLGEIVGEVTTEHILDEVFSRFCIGK